eukprot:GFYU01002301.1.p1 GENE.GFYU01002301.1~~GFYU01002301.1.p1  ORF type:complete len:1052 (-),score=217.44 GFYU01002301.1:225-3380(-)
MDPSRDDRDVTGESVSRTVYVLKRQLQFDPEAFQLSVEEGPPGTEPIMYIADMHEHLVNTTADGTVVFTTTSSTAGNSGESFAASGMLSGLVESAGHLFAAQLEKHKDRVKEAGDDETVITILPGYHLKTRTVFVVEMPPSLETLSPADQASVLTAMYHAVLVAVRNCGCRSVAVEVSEQLSEDLEIVNIEALMDALYSHHLLLRRSLETVPVVALHHTTQRAQCKMSAQFGFRLTCTPSIKSWGEREESTLELSLASPAYTQDALIALQRTLGHRLATALDMNQSDESRTARRWGHYDPDRINRRDHKLQRGNVIQLSSILGYNEHLLMATRIIEEKPEKVAHEYAKSYRDCSRITTKSPELADELWKRIAAHLTIDDVRGVKPYGFGTDGEWVPVGINDCFRCIMYKNGGHFRAHRDGGFVYNDNYRSVFSVVVYLRMDAASGRVAFFDEDSNGNPTTSYTLSPGSGSALIFSQDILHAGLQVAENEKVIMRSDIMFRRVDYKNVNPRSYLTDPAYRHCQQLYTASIEKQFEGQPHESTEAFVEAMEMQAQESPSITTGRRLGGGGEGPSECGWFDELSEDLLALMFSYLPLSDLGTVARVCWTWNLASKDALIWKKLFEEDYPEAAVWCKETQMPQVADPGVHLRNDWHIWYKARHIAEVQCPTLFVDIGADTTNFFLSSNVPAIDAADRDPHGRWGVSSNVFQKVDVKTVPSLVATTNGHYWSSGSGVGHFLVANEVVNGGLEKNSDYPITARNKYNVMYPSADGSHHSLSFKLLPLLIEWMLECQFAVPLMVPSVALLVAEPMRGFTPDERSHLEDMAYHMESPYVGGIPSAVLCLAGQGISTGTVVSLQWPDPRVVVVDDSRVVFNDTIEGFHRELASSSEWGDAHTQLIVAAVSHAWTTTVTTAVDKSKSGPTNSDNWANVVWITGASSHKVHTDGLRQDLRKAHPDVSTIKVAASGEPQYDVSRGGKVFASVTNNEWFKSSAQMRQVFRRKDGKYTNPLGIYELIHNTTMNLAWGDSSSSDDDDTSVSARPESGWPSGWGRPR